MRYINLFLVFTIFVLIPLISIIHYILHMIFSWNTVLGRDEHNLITAWLITYPLVGLMNILGWIFVRRLVKDVITHL